MRRYCCPRTYFYPRPPRGGRLGVIGQYGHRLIFLSTPSARRATKPSSKKSCISPISIHALREEGDHEWREERLHEVEFLSTPSARRATRHRRGGHLRLRFLSTPSARRATLYLRKPLEGY